MGASSQVSVSGPSNHRRNASAFRCRCSVEPGSASCTATDPPANHDGSQVRLRAPVGRVGAEAEGRPVGCPRQRNPAAVAALLGTAGRGDIGSWQRVGGQVGDLVQPELFALVEVGGPGQSQHQQGRRPSPPQPRARGRAPALAVGPQPRLRLLRGPPVGGQSVAGGDARTTSWLDSTQVEEAPTARALGKVAVMTRRNSSASPVGFEQVEVERLAEALAGWRSAARRDGCTHASATAMRGGSYSLKTCRHSA